MLGDNQYFKSFRICRRSIYKANNFNRLKSKAKSVEIIEICGISISSPLDFPLTIMAFIKFVDIFNTNDY